MNRDQFFRIAKALADPRRFEIFERIAQDEEFACRQLCECFPISQATVSHHLKELMNAGLITARREGQFMHLSAHQDVLDAYLAEVKNRVSAETAAGKRRRS